MLGVDRFKHIIDVLLLLNATIGRDLIMAELLAFHLVMDLKLFFPLGL